MPETNTQLSFSKSLAFIIGINDYQHVPPLQTAVSDAEKLAEVLADQGFDVHPPLLDANGADLRGLIEKTLPEKVGKDDRVFFYFAGHGIAADGEDGPAGYIVPADADPTDVKTFIPMDALQQSLNALPCRHLLLVLDCCFSGAFKWSSQHRAIGTLMPKRIYKERFDRFIQDAAWQVITSAAYDQKALDVLNNKPLGDHGVVTAADDDGKPHSPFALALFSGLAGEADVKVGQEGDGVITATELYAYVRDQIEPATIKESEKLRQTPGFFPLKKHDKGEFIFLHPHHRLNLPPIPKRNPYKGLQSFDEEDKELFYGRDRVIKELREKAESNKLLVISGASGTGKSSVIKAGLLPVLREEGFHILPVVRPGINPVASLENKLNELKIYELTGPSLENLKKAGLPDEILAALETLKDQKIIDEQRFLHALKKKIHEEEDYEKYNSLILQHVQASRFFVSPIALNDAQAQSTFIAELSKQKTVLVIDQYEELITRCPNPAEREQFDALLRKILDETPAETLKIILTVRADFEPQLNEGALATYWRAGRCTVPPFSMEELKEVIVMPTIQEVMIFDPPEMVNDIIEEVVQSPGALPLLSYTLSELYEAYRQSGRQDRALKKEDYEKLGGVMGALRTKADKLYHGLETGQQNTMRKIMLRMVSLEGELAGKRVMMEELVFADDAENQRVNNVIDQLVDARLIVKGKDYIEPAHDALVRAWKMLREWIHTIGEDKIMLYEKANEAAKEFAQSQNLKFLWNDNPHLQVLQQELSRREQWFNAKEIRFIQQSVQRKQKRARIFRSVTAAVIIALSGLTLWAVLNAQRATRNFKSAQSNFLASQADAAFATDNTVALRIAEAAYAMTPGNPQPAACKILSEIFHSQGRSRFYAANLQHGEQVNSAVFSPDDQYMLTASDDVTAKLWNRQGKFILSFPHPDAVNAAVFSSDGKCALTLSERNTAVKLWNLNGTLLDSLKRDDEVNLANFSTDGAHLVVQNNNQIIGEKFLPEREQILAASIDRIKILTRSTDGVVRLWGAEGKLLATLPHSYEVTSATFSYDGKQVLTVSADSTVRFWDENGNFIDALKYKAEVIQAVFSPDGKQILIASKDNTAKLWDFSQTFVQRIPKHGSDETAIAAVFSPDGTRILSSMFNKTVKLWDERGNLLDSLAHDGDLTSAVFSPDGRRVLTASKDDSARLWTPDGARVIKFAHRGEVNSAVFSPKDSSQILTASSDRTAKLWKANGDSIFTFHQHGEVTSAVFSPDGQYILTALKDGTAKLWKANGDSIKSFKHDGEVNAAVFSSDGRRILTASSDSTAGLWRTDGSSIARLAHRGEVRLAVFSPDGRHILTAAEDSVKLWNEEGNLITSLKHKYNVTSAIFSPDGKFILTASEDFSAKLWNLKGEPVAEYQHTDVVNAAVFSRDGKCMLTASNYGAVKIWWTPNAIFEWLQTAAVYRLMPEEERQYGISE